MRSSMLYSSLAALVLATMFMAGSSVAQPEFTPAGMEEEGIYERPNQPEGRWQRNKKNLIYNFLNMYQPCIVEIPDPEYPWRVWFFGWATEDTNPDLPGCDAIYYGRSKDLTRWELYMGDDGPASKIRVTHLMLTFCCECCSIRYYKQPRKESPWTLSSNFNNKETIS